MSTYQGIAVVTQALQYVAGSAARAAVPEATISVASPTQQPAAAQNDVRLNIYLVQASPEPTLVGTDLPRRDTNGALTGPARVALNLRYLLSFYGPSPKDHLMLGAVELALRENGILGPTVVNQAVAAHPELQNSRLDQQLGGVQLAPRPIALEELSRLWSGFFQVPYTLSTLFDASVVLIESETPVTISRPVRVVDVRAVPRVVALDPVPAVDYAPGLAVAVSGPGVGPGLPLSVDGAWTQVEAAAGGGGLQFRLPAGIGAGAHLVRVGELTPPSPQPAVAPAIPSQVLVIRPVVTATTYDAAAGQVVLTVSPPPGPGQVVTGVLIPLAGPVAGFPTSLQLAPPVSITGAAVSFGRSGAAAATYLAMVEVDGILSNPNPDLTPNGGPQVVLP